MWPNPNENLLGIRDPVSCPGEALKWPSSEYPGSTNMMSGRRGSLAGLNPEALCGRPRKVSRGTTGATQNKSCEDKRGKNWGEDRKADDHHRGQKRA